MRQTRRKDWNFGKKYCAAPHTPPQRRSPNLAIPSQGAHGRACLRQARPWAASPPTRVSAQPKPAACAAKRAPLHPCSAFKQVGFISWQAKRRGCKLWLSGFRERSGWATAYRRGRAAQRNCGAIPLPAQAITAACEAAVMACAGALSRFAGQALRAPAP